jgi:hypothetical protein
LFGNSIHSINNCYQKLNFQNIIIRICFNYISFTQFSDFVENSIIDLKVQSTSDHLLSIIITLFSTLAFAVILVVIFGVIIRCRKASIKNQRPKNEKHHNHNQFKFDDGLEKYDDIINGNEENSYETPNYKSDKCYTEAYDEINYDDLNVVTNETVKYLEIFE